MQSRCSMKVASKNDKFVKKGVMYFDVKNVQHDTVSVGFIKFYRLWTYRYQVYRFLCSMWMCMFMCLGAQD